MDEAITPLSQREAIATNQQQPSPLDVMIANVEKVLTPQDRAEVEAERIAPRYAENLLTALMNGVDIWNVPLPEPAGQLSPEEKPLYDKVLTDKVVPKVQDHVKAYGRTMTLAAKIMHGEKLSKFERASLDSMPDTEKALLLKYMSLIAKPGKQRSIIERLKRVGVGWAHKTPELFTQTLGVTLPYLLGSEVKPIAVTQAEGLRAMVEPLTTPLPPYASRAERIKGMLAKGFWSFAEMAPDLAAAFAMEVAVSGIGALVGAATTAETGPGAAAGAVAGALFTVPRAAKMLGHVLGSAYWTSLFFGENMELYKQMYGLDSRAAAAGALGTALAQMGSMKMASRFFGPGSFGVMKKLEEIAMAERLQAGKIATNQFLDYVKRAGMSQLPQSFVEGLRIATANTTKRYLHTYANLVPFAIAAETGKQYARYLKFGDVDKREFVSNIWNSLIELGFTVPFMISFAAATDYGLNLSEGLAVQLDKHVLTKKVREKLLNDTMFVNGIASALIRKSPGVKHEYVDILRGKLIEGQKITAADVWNLLGTKIPLREKDARVIAQRIIDEYTKIENDPSEGIWNKISDASKYNLSFGVSPFEIDWHGANAFEQVRNHFILQSGIHEQKTIPSLFERLPQEFKELYQSKKLPYFHLANMVLRSLSDKFVNDKENYQKIDSETAKALTEETFAGVLSHIMYSDDFDLLTQQEKMWVATRALLHACTMPINEAIDMAVGLEPSGEGAKAARGKVDYIPPEIMEQVSSIVKKVQAATGTTVLARPKDVNLYAVRMQREEAARRRHQVASAGEPIVATGEFQVALPEAQPRPALRQPQALPAPEPPAFRRQTSRTLPKKTAAGVEIIPKDLQRFSPEELFVLKLRRAMDYAKRQASEELKKKQRGAAKMIQDIMDVWGNRDKTISYIISRLGVNVEEANRLYDLAWGKDAKFMRKVRFDINEFFDADWFKYLDRLFRKAPEEPFKVEREVLTPQRVFSLFPPQRSALPSGKPINEPKKQPAREPQKIKREWQQRLKRIESARKKLATLEDYDVLLREVGELVHDLDQVPEDQWLQEDEQAWQEANKKLQSLADAKRKLWQEILSAVPPVTKVRPMTSEEKPAPAMGEKRPAPKKPTEKPKPQPQPKPEEQPKPAPKPQPRPDEGAAFMERYYSNLEERIQKAESEADLREVRGDLAQAQTYLKQLKKRKLFRGRHQAVEQMLNEAFARFQKPEEKSAEKPAQQAAEAPKAQEGVKPRARQEKRPEREMGAEKDVRRKKASINVEYFFAGFDEILREAPETLQKRAEKLLSDLKSRKAEAQKQGAWTEEFEKEYQSARKKLQDALGVKGPEQRQKPQKIDEAKEKELIQRLGKRLAIEEAVLRELEKRDRAAARKLERDMTVNRLMTAVKEEYGLTDRAQIEKIAHDAKNIMLKDNETTASEVQQFANEPWAKRLIELLSGEKTGKPVPEPEVVENYTKYQPESRRVEQVVEQVADQVYASDVAEIDVEKFKKGDEFLSNGSQVKILDVDEASQTVKVAFDYGTNYGHIETRNFGEVLDVDGGEIKRGGKTIDIVKAQQKLSVEMPRYVTAGGAAPVGSKLTKAKIVAQYLSGTLIPRNTREIYDYLESLFDVPILRGILPKKVLGHYGDPAKGFSKYGLIRGAVKINKRIWGDIVAAAHEVAHKVSDLEGLVREMDGYMRRRFGELDYKSQRMDPEEGLAELLAAYFIGLDASNMDADAYRWLVDAMERHKIKKVTGTYTLKELADKARREIGRYMHGDKRLAAYAQFTGPGYKKSLLRKIEDGMMADFTDLYGTTIANFSDKFVGFKMIDKMVEDVFGRKLNAEETFHARAWLISGAHRNFIHLLLHDGIWSVPTFSPRSENDGPVKLGNAFLKYREHLPDQKWSTIRDFGAWVQLRRAIWLHEKEGMPLRTAKSLKDAKDTLALLETDRRPGENRRQKFEMAAQSLQESFQALWKVLAQPQVGLIDEAFLKRWFKEPYYVPLFPVDLKSRAGRKYAKAWGQIWGPSGYRLAKRYGGGETPVMHPDDAFVWLASKIYRAAFRQVFLNELVDRVIELDKAAAAKGKKFRVGEILTPIEPGKRFFEIPRKMALEALIRSLGGEAEKQAILRALFPTELKQTAASRELAKMLFPSEIADTPEAMAVVKLMTTDYTGLPADTLIYTKGHTYVPFQINSEPARMAFRYLLSSPYDDMSMSLRWSYMAMKVFRRGIIDLNPQFAVRNLIRDLGTFMVNRKFARGPLGLHDWIVGLAAWSTFTLHELGLIKKIPKDWEESLRLYQSFGGYMAGFYGEDLYDIMKRAAEVQSRGKIARFAHFIKRPDEVAASFLGMFEQVPRVAEFMGAMHAQGWGPERIRRALAQNKLPPIDVVMRSIWAAQDVTVNFAVHGAAGIKLNWIFPLANAKLQGIKREIRSATDPNTWYRYWIGNMLVGMVTALAWVQNKDDEEYQEAPSWLKYGFWWVTDNTHFHMEKIPVPREFLPAKIMVESMLNWMHENDPAYLRQMFAELVNEFIPAPFDTLFRTGSVADTVGSAQIIRPVYEAMKNWDIWKQTPLMSPAERMKNIPAYLKGTQRVHPFYKWVARMMFKWLPKNMQAPPKMIQHVVDGYTGKLATPMIEFASLALETAGLLSPNEYTTLPMSTKRKLASLSGLVSNYPYTTSPTELGESFAKADEEYNLKRGQIIDQLTKEGKEVTNDLVRSLMPEDIVAKRYVLGRQWKFVRQLLTLAKKAQTVPDLWMNRRLATGLARAALGKPTGPSYPNPLASTGWPDKVQEVIDNEIMSAIGILSRNTISKGEEQYANWVLKQAGINADNVRKYIDKYLKAHNRRAVGRGARNAISNVIRRLRQ